jgi:hypothetical protein
MRQTDISRGRDGVMAAVALEDFDVIRYKTEWRCEKYDQDKIDFVIDQLQKRGDNGVIHRVGGKDIWRPFEDGVPSDILKDFSITPDDIMIVPGNLLVNEGLQRMRDLLVAAGGVAYNNANAFIGVGDTATAEAATQTELQAAAAATNRFYKGMNATFPTTAGQGASWASDFTSTEGNFIWNEWTVAAGATTASGAGFLVGTTNLNRKVASLGTKTTGTWTLTATITFA